MPVHTNIKEKERDFGIGRERVYMCLIFHVPMRHAPNNGVYAVGWMRETTHGCR